MTNKMKASEIEPENPLRCPHCGATYEVDYVWAYDSDDSGTKYERWRCLACQGEFESVYVCVEVRKLDKAGRYTEEV